MSELTRCLRILDEGLWDRLGSLRRFAVANKALLAYLIVVSIVAFGYDLFGFSLKTDAELHALTPGAKIEWIQQGRWAMYWLSSGLMPDPVLPFVPVLIALLGLGCGVLLFILSLSQRRTISDYLAAPLAVGCPLLAFGFYFTTLNYGLGVGVAAVGAGQYLLTRWSRSSAALAIVCFAVAIGIYQSMVLLIPVMFAFYLVVQVITAPRFDMGSMLRRLGVFCVVAIGACGLYELMKVVTLRAYRVPYAHEYLQTYLNWGTDPAYWQTTLGKTVLSAKAYYTGSADFYLYKLGIVALLFWTVLGITIVRLLATASSPTAKVLGFVALAGGLVAPLVLHLFNGGHMPPRTVLGVPFVFAGLVFCATIDGNRTVSAVLAVLVVTCFFKFAVVNGRYALANELAWKADQDLSLLILQRIHSVWHKLPGRGPPYPVVIVGMLEADESPLHVRRDLIGSSFYYTNGGSAERVVGVWRGMRQFDFRKASNQEALSVAGRSIVMPIWPADGSVDVVDGVVVVKIGDFTAEQITTLCDRAPANDFCERDAQRLLTLAATGAGTAAIHQGRWEISPAGSEDGSGLELAHQGDTVFVSWFTYDPTGRNWWAVMAAQRQKVNVYAGPLVEMRGSSFAATFNPGAVVSTTIGNGALTFRDANNAIFDYTVNGRRQSKPVARAVLGALPTCPRGETRSELPDTNYRGLWSASPAGSEPGWGLTLNQQGDRILGTWFTHDTDGAPLWLSIDARKTGGSVYAGDLVRTSGERLHASDPAAIRSSKIGAATLTFRDANNATFAFTIDDARMTQAARSKAITRAVIDKTGLPCRWQPAIQSSASELVESGPVQAVR